MRYPRHLADAKKHFYGERAFWVKGQEAYLVKARDLTVILRPGDRSDPKIPQCLPLNEPLPIFFLIPGTGDPKDRLKPPEFEEDDGTTVRVISRTIRALKDITDDDLEFGSGAAVVHQASEIKRYFEEVQDPGKTLNPESPLTIYRLEYVD